MKRLGWSLGALALGACGGGEAEPPGPGDVVTFVGTGEAAHDGDGHTAAETTLHSPMEVVPTPGGVTYILDWNNHAVRAIGLDGVVETFAGTEPDEIFGDWPCEDVGDPAFCDIPLDQVAPADAVQMNHPMDVALLPDGSLAIAAWHNHKVERCTAERQVSVLAGRMKPGADGDGGPAADAHLNFPDSLVVDATGALLVSDQRNNRIRRIELDGERLITNVAGVGGLSAASGDGGPATEAELGLSPYDLAGGADNPPPGGGLALAADGRLYFADTYNHCIRVIDPGTDGVLGVGDPAEEIIDVVAGQCGTAGLEGDGGSAAAALMSRPHDVELGPDGRLYVADTHNHVVRAVDLGAGTIDRVAGTGEMGYSGDGGPALEATFRRPYGIGFDLDDALLIVDTENNRIRRVLP